MDMPHYRQVGVTVCRTGQPELSPAGYLDVLLQAPPILSDDRVAGLQALLHAIAALEQEDGQLFHVDLDVDQRSIVELEEPQFARSVVDHLPPLRKHQEH